MPESYIASKLVRAESIDSMNLLLAEAARFGWTYLAESICELQGGLVACLTAEVQEILQPIPRYLEDDALPLAQALYAEKEDVLHTAGYRMISNSKVGMLSPGQLCYSMLIVEAARFRHREVDFAVAMVRLHQYDAPIVVLVKSYDPLRPASRKYIGVYQP